MGEKMVSVSWIERRIPNSEATGSNPVGDTTIQYF